jgi:class 3 adenylate cyclase
VGDRRWGAVLDQHDAVAKREIATYRGKFIKTTGDGVLATFDGPARAIACACDLRDELRPLGIEVRMGLHTGEVELRDHDLGGIAVHISARISGIAQPGQVLVSRTVTDLVAGSGIEFDECGEHRLKGVSGTWPLFSVVRT